MKFAADFHIHSRFSRATSKDLTLENLDAWAAKKGITVLGTGDFTHPLWFQELKSQLEPAEQGLFKRRDRLVRSPSSHNVPTRFLLTAEVSCIYSKKGRVRRVHLILFAPSLEAAEKINTQLGWVGNLKSDGRPILGMDAKEAVKVCLKADERCLVVPSHCWTPWFSVFGSKSGFNSLQECFDEYTKYIYAVETGLSSDPAMNWRLSQLDNITLISNSDSHSLHKIGREANMFDADRSYDGIADAIRAKDPKKFLFTVEFFPEEGKYHYDGHRACQVSMTGAESKAHNNICPKCGRPLTIGVLNRVEELADRPEGFRPENPIPYTSMIPLEEIIADTLGVGVGTKQVNQEYEGLVSRFGSEFAVLLDASQADLKDAALPQVARGIEKVRAGEVRIEPGYDGEYGKVQVFREGEADMRVSQKSLF